MKQLKKIVYISIILLLILASYVKIMELWNKNKIENCLIQYFNRAVTIGIMTSIKDYHPDTNNNGKFGSFQSDIDKLKTFCNDKGYALHSLKGQLNYFIYELKTTHKNLWEKLQSLEDTPEGAYNATYYFAKEYLGYEMNAIEKLALKAKARRFSK